MINGGWGNIAAALWFAVLGLTYRDEQR